MFFLPSSKHKQENLIYSTSCPKKDKVVNLEFIFLGRKYASIFYARPMERGSDFYRFSEKLSLLSWMGAGEETYSEGAQLWAQMSCYSWCLMLHYLEALKSKCPSVLKHSLNCWVWQG